MHFLFPCDPLDPRQPDEFFGEQLAALASAGFSTSLCREEVIEGKRLKGMPPGSRVVYRGWMMNAEEYAGLVRAIEAAGASPFIAQQEYLAAHHLPNWYPLISEFTPETHIYPADANLVRELKVLRWDSFFVKDYVKSLKTSLGSLIRDPSRIPDVVAEMKAYRGEIEGGICIRRVEDFLTETERRYFVINGRPHAPDESGHVPDLVWTCAQRIPSKFFSVDVVERRDGTLRIVEVGDGQVSDLVGWTPEAFARAWVRAVA